MVHKTGSISDLVAALAIKASIPENILPRLRVFEAHNHKNQKELPATYPIVSLSEYSPLYADIRAEDEVNRTEDDRMVMGFSFDRETSKSHGYPFSFVVHEGETLADAKDRVGRRVGLSKKVLEKVKFCAVPKTNYAKPVIIEDGKLFSMNLSGRLLTHSSSDEVLSERLGASDLLGLDYQPRNRGILGRVDQMFIK